MTPLEQLRADAADLVRRLRNRASQESGEAAWMSARPAYMFLREAADTIERLAARVAEPEGKWC